MSKGKIAVIRAMRISDIAAKYAAGAWTPAQAKWARALFANLRGAPA
jgi:hypothetical protein